MADAKITGLTENTTPLVTDIAAVVDDPSGSPVTQKITLANLLFKITNFHIGTFTRDLTTSAGTQAVSGVGFQPRVVVFLATVSGSSMLSIGFDDGTNAYCVRDQHQVTADTYGPQSSYSIELVQGASYNPESYAKITTLGSDGFTLTWAKSGIASGTATIYYLALR
jgi:hypothetical protein